MFRDGRTVLLAAGLALAGCEVVPEGDGEGPSIPWTQGPDSFHEPLDAFDPGRWFRADAWTTGGEFNVGWRADHIRFADGKMELRLDTTPCPEGCSGRPYASGEYASTRYYGFGRYEVRMKPARGSGTVTSFVLHTGASEQTRWDEIDIEFLGKDTRRFQTNYFTDGVGRHETMIDLPFDAADDFHTYGFEYTREAIHWYVDGKRVHTETGTRGPLPFHPGKVIMNFWPGTGIDIWSGAFTYPGSPMVATYDSIRHAPAAAMTVLEDFESSTALGAWTVVAGSGAQLSKSSQGGHMGAKALALDYSVGTTARASVVRYSSAAHPPPLLVPLEGPARVLSEGGPLLGVGAGDLIEEGQVRLSPGDRLFLYTDGAFEVSDEAGDHFGQERLHALLQSRRELPLEALCDEVLGALRRHRGNLPVEDNLTLLALEFQGAAT